MFLTIKTHKTKNHLKDDHKNKMAAVPRAACCNSLTHSTHTLLNTHNDNYNYYYLWLRKAKCINTYMLEAGARVTFILSQYSQLCWKLKLIFTKRKYVFFIVVTETSILNNVRSRLFFSLHLWLYFVEKKEKYYQLLL